MKNKKRDWESMYNTYLKDYAKAEEKSYVFGGKGNYIRLSDRLSINQFKTVYTAVENEENRKRLERISEGKNPTKSINVLRKTIDTQKISVMSRDQAKSIKVALKKTYNEKISIRDLMVDNVAKIDNIDSKIESMWDQIYDYYYKWKEHRGEPGWDSVGQVYFGSP